MKARIELTKHGRGRVFLDGVEQECVVSIKLETQVNGVNLLTLTQCVKEVEVTAEEIDITSLCDESKKYVPGIPC